MSAIQCELPIAVRLWFVVLINEKPSAILCVRVEEEGELTRKIQAYKSMTKGTISLVPCGGMLPLIDI